MLLALLLKRHEGEVDVCLYLRAYLFLFINTIIATLEGQKFDLVV